jgi:hypothetical protein
MMFRRMLLLLTFVSCSSMVWAMSGTPEEQAACGPDVRKFCAKVPPGSGDMAYLTCLVNNRDALSVKCMGAWTLKHGLSLGNSRRGALTDVRSFRLDFYE